MIGLKTKNPHLHHGFSYAKKEGLLRDPKKGEYTIIKTHNLRHGFSFAEKEAPEPKR